MNTSKNRSVRARFVLVAAAGLIAATAPTALAAERVFSGPAPAQTYTVLDHPSQPCNLSLEAVANWGETSTHLPLACTYGE